MTTNNKKYSVERGEQYPLVGNFINYHISQQLVTKADVARALNIAPKGLADYCKRETLQFAVLWKLSLVLKHNFIAQLGEYLPYRFETIREKALLKQLAEKEEIIEKLEIQIQTLREFIIK
jgi:hypothetical protein